MTGSQRDRVIAACTAKPGSSVGDYPFGDEVAVVKLAGTMFALMALGPAPGSVSLKFDQDLAAGLRGRHATFTAGYHLNKRHWSTVTLDGSAPLIIQAAQVQEELGGGRWRVVDLIVTIPHESQ